MNEINRKSIFMAGLKNKVSYVFNYNDLAEVEAIINFYEKKLKQRDEVTEKVIKMLEINIELTKEQPSNDKLADEFIIERFNDLLKTLQKYKGDKK